MKTTEFIVENSLIAQEAATMHQDHEVQMARADCYNAADYAIQIHRMLKHVSEQEGIEGWVSEKITSANNALRDVAEYLRYEKQDGQEMMEFVYESAEYALGKLITEESQNSGVAGAIIQRILHQRPDLLKAYGPELVKSAVDNVAGLMLIKLLSFGCRPTRRSRVEDVEYHNFHIDTYLIRLARPRTAMRAPGTARFCFIRNSGRSPDRDRAASRRGTEASATALKVRRTSWKC